MTKPILFHEIAYESQKSGLPLLRNESRWLPDYGKHVRTLYESCWLLMLALIIGGLAAALYAVAVRPVYEASMLIHVEADNIGRRPTQTLFGEIGAMLRRKAVPDEESEMIRSRLVISRAIDNVGGFIDAAPNYFPVFGRWLAQRKPDLIQRPGYLGYAWGSEAIDVKAFTMPDAFLNRRFVVVAGDAGNFRLEDEAGHVYGAGRTGASLIVESATGPIKLLVGRMEAPAGVRFFLARKSRLALIEGVQENLRLQASGRQGGVIRVALSSVDPSWAQSVLAQIGTQYMTQNAARGAEGTSTALAYVDEQLPQLKRQLEESELRYSRFRNSKGMVDPGEETKAELQQLAAARLRKSDLEQKLNDLLVRFTPNHPIVIGAESQLRDVNLEIRSIGSRMKLLPQVDTELAKLSREVKVNSELYAAQLDVARQLRFVRASQTSNVRLVDMPMLPEQPVSTEPAKIVVIGLLAGLLAGVGAAFARRTLKRGVDDPLEIEEMVNLPVFASVPMSRQQKSLRAALRAHLRGRNGVRAEAQPLLARDAPQDEAVESLRNFRAVFQYARLKNTNNISLFISPTAGNGKSFVSANLTTLLGAGSKRVLLIDADLRNGDLHHYFQLAPGRGLADALTGAAPLDSLIHYNVAPNVDLLPASPTAHSSELLLHPNFAALLRIVAQRYDMVVMNGAPVLEVSDALVLGAHAGAIYVVAQAGVSTLHDMAQTVRMLRQAGLTASGCLLNGAKSGAPQRSRRYDAGKRWNTQYLPGPVEGKGASLSIERS